MDSIIHRQVLLPCGPGEAFSMFTRNRLLESWLARKAEVEPVEGGKFELFWQPENKRLNSTLGCRITAIEPDRFLSFEWRSPEQFKHFANQADPLTHVVVFFVPEDEGTRVHLVHSGWRSSDDWEQARQWQDQAWCFGLQALEDRVSTG